MLLWSSSNLNLIKKYEVEEVKKDRKKYLSIKPKKRLNSGDG